MARSCLRAISFSKRECRLVLGSSRCFFCRSSRCASRSSSRCRSLLGSRLTHYRSSRCSSRSYFFMCFFFFLAAGCESQSQGQAKCERDHLFHVIHTFFLLLLSTVKNRACLIE